MSELDDPVVSIKHLAVLNRRLQSLAACASFEAAYIVHRLVAETATPMELRRSFKAVFSAVCAMLKNKTTFGRNPSPVICSTPIEAGENKTPDLRLSAILIPHDFLNRLNRPFFSSTPLGVINNWRVFYDDRRCVPNFDSRIPPVRF